MSNSITTQIVGAHFRPPAKALLACLPNGQQLGLRPEPSNPYDENAVQVLLRSADIPDECWEELELQLAGAGFDKETIMSEPLWHLGYMPKAAKGNPDQEALNVEHQQVVHRFFADQHISDDLEVLPCALSFDTAGKPTIIISPWPPEPV